MKAHSHPSLVLHLLHRNLHVPTPSLRIDSPLRFSQPRPQQPKYYYDPRSGRWYQLQNQQQNQLFVPETYEDQLTEAGDGHSFWAIVKESLIILLLVSIALGIAVGSVCLMGFEEPVLRIAEGIVNWFGQLKLVG